MLLIVIAISNFQILSALQMKCIFETIPLRNTAAAETNKSPAPITRCYHVHPGNYAL